MTIRMAACNQIIGYLDDLLDPTAYDDYGPNGLQVPGSEQIQTVVTGVSANAELFTRAREEGADLVLVHHGLFWAVHRDRWTTPPSGACSSSSTPTSRSPPTTCRSTATSRSATTRCSHGPSAARRSSPSRPTATRPSASARGSPARASLPPSSSRACTRPPG